jgi:Polysaccharide pyruvyl transferase
LAKLLHNTHVSSIEPATENLVVLTPYLLGTAFQKHKSVNLGDGIILRAMERLIGIYFRPECLISPRVPLNDESRNILSRTKAILIAGANQLNDNYTIVPGFDSRQLPALAGVIVPFALGLHGAPAYAQGMSQKTRQILRGVHERIRFSSWRCPLTLEYLAREIPEIRDQLLMTGCVVIYDEPLLNGTPFAAAVDSIAVTATERDDFWSRETATLRAVAGQFPKAARYLVVHQDYVGNWSWQDMIGSVLNRSRRKRLMPRKLRSYAQSLGFQVVVPSDADAATRFYRQIDMHFGSRLHAHLLFLSQAKRSFLTHVDDRAVGMAAAFDFPLCKPERLMDEIDFDFEIVRKAARQHFATMQHFISCMREDAGLI